MDFPIMSNSTPILKLTNSNAKDVLNIILSTFPEYRLANHIDEYGLMTEIILGCGANFSALIVMLTLSSVTMCNYMAALAIADLNVLLGPCLIRWLLTQNVQPTTSSAFVCKFLQFHSYWSFSASAWLLVAMTVDRYIAVGFPLRAPRISTPARAKVVICGIILVIAIVNSHFFFTMHVKDRLGLKMCMCYDEYSHFLDSAWPWIDATVYSFLPFVLIIAFNAFTLNNYKQSFLRTKSVSGVQGVAMTSRLRKDFKLTGTLLTVSFAFIILTAPKALLLITRSHFFSFDPQAKKVDFESMAKYSLTYSLMNMLMYANHSVNFFLYCLTGRKFRLQLIQIIQNFGQWVRKKNIRVAPFSTSGSQHLHHRQLTSISFISKTKSRVKITEKPFVMGKPFSPNQGKSAFMDKIIEEPN